MPAYEQKFEFSIGDRVIIKEVQRPGRVELIQIDFVGVQYRVCYWDNSERKVAWLYADEIEPRK